MFIVKVALFNSQKSIVDEKGDIGFGFCSQKIVDISFNGFGEHTYSKQDQVKQIETKEDGKILWRNQEWDSISEEYVVISSSEPFSVTIEDTNEEIGEQGRKNSLNQLTALDAIEVVMADIENLEWKTLNQDDSNYSVVNTAEKQTNIPKPTKADAKKRLSHLKLVE